MADKEEAADDEQGAKGSKKKLIIILVAVTLLLLGGVVPLHFSCCRAMAALMVKLSRLRRSSERRSIPRSVRWRASHPLW